MLGVRVAAAADKMRLVLGTEGPVDHRGFTLSALDRVVVDIPAARLTGTLPDAAADDATLVGLRSGVRAGEDLRIVLDLKQPARIKSFTWAPRVGTGTDWLST